MSEEIEKKIRPPDLTEKLRKLLDPNRPDERPEAKQLLENIKASLPSLEELLKESSDHWGYEDPVYRFYHQSYKVYNLQETTLNIVVTLKRLAPMGRDVLCEWFMKIVQDGTGKEFEIDHNDRWLEVTRPILEAFFHAKYFLEMVVQYGKELEFAPALLPSGWASVLYLYGLR